MADYKNPDRFKRTSKEIDPNIHKPEHIRRWSWIGKEGKTFAEITAPDSGYRKTLVDDRNYQGNHSKIGHHLTYDIEQISMIKRVQKNKEELIFGHIEGVKVGQIFDSREELALSGVHTPPMHGIWGREDEGSSSIVISGGYEDDIDNLDYILYTGQGGQDAPGGKQVADQEFTRGNKGLLLSKDYNLPVRVTRGFQVEHGPDEGYRYDGLYYVTLCERVIGKSGYYVCRFHLESEKTLGEIEDSLEGTLPESYEKTDRTETTVSKIKRSIKLREKIKKMYDHKCQVCGIRLEKPNGAIAIGAHIKGLGKPHNGPDAINNMLCLCPNHHDQFDALSFYIESSNMEIVGLEQFKNKKLVIKPKHKIDTEFLDYQKERYELANGKTT
tara:strand:+ start:83 stop:1237 length:1155 start_codon:yes stop_codon:yes gene_type:complete